MSNNEYYNQNKGHHDQHYPPQGIFFSFCSCTTFDSERRPSSQGLTASTAVAIIHNNPRRRISKEATPNKVVMLPSLNHR